MRAAWYERPGTAADVLQVGEMSAQAPGPGEVCVQLSRSGVNPGDTKKRGDWQGATLPFPRVIPHSDGAGVVHAVGAGVGLSRVGQRVWVYGAQSYRPFGTAAQFTTLPADQAVELPDDVSDEIGACLGIPGITAHRTVFADGPVAGKTILVQGVLGAVGSIAAQLAHWRGASVIGTVRYASDLPRVPAAVAHAVALDADDAAEQIRAAVPGGVDRIIEVSFSDNIDLDAAVVAPDAIIAAYATRDSRPSIPFWPMLFSNLKIHLFGSDDFPHDAKRRAAQDLTAAAHEKALSIAIGEPLPLDRIAEAHEKVDAGAKQRVLLSIPA